MVSSTECFLNDVYGYAKLGALMRGEKPEDMQLRKFLDGTMLGTWGPYHMPAPHVIRTTDNMKRYPSHDCREDLHYHIAGQNLFCGYNGDEAREFLEKYAAPLFPDAPVRSQALSFHNTWMHQMDSGDFRLILTGAAAGNTTRVLTVDFNAPEETVEQINRTVGRYYGMINNQARF